MRMSQAFWGVMGSVGTLFYALIAGGVLPSSWVVLLIIVAFETALTAFPAWVHAVRAVRRRASKAAPMRSPGGALGQDGGGGGGGGMALGTRNPPTGTGTVPTLGGGGGGSAVLASAIRASRLDDGEEGVASGAATVTGQDVV